MSPVWLAALAFAQEPVVEEAPAELVQPQLVHEVAADYPPDALRDGVEAELVLEIDVGADGLVEDVRVLESAGEAFDTAALEAVRQYRFTPATVAGEAVPVRISYLYAFVLDDVVVPEDAAADPVVNFSGVVRERGRRTLLPSLRVTVFRPDGDAVEAVTDADGAFAFTDLAPGLWTVAVTGEGIRRFESEEEIVADTHTEVVLFVFGEQTSDFDVVVEGERPRKEVTRHTLTVEQIDRVPGTFGDPLNVVQNLPGVSPQGLGDGTLIVRGSSPEDTGLFLAGTRIPLFTHFGGVRSVLPLGMIADLTFYPGNAPLPYGRLTGGVLEIEPADPRPDAFHGSIDLNLFDTAAFIEVPLGDRGALLAGGRRSWFDVVLGAVLPEDGGFQLTAAPRFYDLQALLAYRPSTDHDLRLLYLGSGDQFVALFDNPRDFDPQFTTTDLEARLGQQHVALYHDWRISERVTSSARVGGLIALQKFTAGPEQRLELKAEELTLREEVRATLHDRFDVRVGADAVLGVDDVEVYTAAPVKEGEYFAYEQDANRFVEDRSGRFDGGAFAELTVEPVDGLVLIGGARTDWFGPMDEVTVDPRVTARVAVLDELALKAGVGMFHQAPTVDELAPEFGNPDLRTEAARHVSAGFEWRPAPYFVLDVTGFDNQLFHGVNQTDRGVEDADGNIVPLRYDNSGIGRIRGLEVLARHDLNRNLAGWIAYTLSRSERQDGFSADEDTWRLFDYDRPHVLTAVASYRLPRSWEVSGRFRYMSGQPSTPVESSVFVSDDDLFTPVIGDINSERFLPLHTLDLRIDKTWDFRRWSLDTYLDVQNVYNNTKTGGLAYNYDYSEAEAAPGLPIFPALGVKGTW